MRIPKITETSLFIFYLITLSGASKSSRQCVGSALGQDTDNVAVTADTTIPPVYECVLMWQML